MVAKIKSSRGYFKGGMPYNKTGGGPKTLVIFQGLVFENKPMPGFMEKQFPKMYGRLGERLYDLRCQPQTGRARGRDDDGHRKRLRRYGAR